MKPDPSHVFIDRPFNDAHKKPTMKGFVETLNQEEKWKVLHFHGASNARRVLFSNHEELTIAKIRAMDKVKFFSRMFLVSVLKGDFSDTVSKSRDKRLKDQWVLQKS